VDERQESIAVADRPGDYAGLLWIFFAGALGFSLFCATSAIALSDPTLPTPIVIEPGNIADFAFSNLNTAAALTAEAFQKLVATSTPTATFISTVTQTATPTSSPTFTRTPFIPTSTPTSSPQPRPTIVRATATRTPQPTNTPIIIVPVTGTATEEELPTDTPVPEPPTDTPEPPPTTAP
jgi:hypothetical protein